MARLTLRKPPPQKMQVGGDINIGPTEDDIARQSGQLTTAEQNLTQQFPNLINLITTNYRINWWCRGCC